MSLYLLLALMMYQNTPKTPKVKFPKITRAYIVLTPKQARLPGNEGILPCRVDGPVNDRGACIDLKARDITNRLYSTKDSCEQWEHTACTQDQWMFAPIGKVIFEDVEDLPDTIEKGGK